MGWEEKVKLECRLNDDYLDWVKLVFSGAKMQHFIWPVEHWG